MRPVSIGAGPGAAEPNLAAVPGAGVLASWLEPVGDTAHALRFAHRDAGGEWSEPRTIAEGPDWFVNWADFPSLLPLSADSIAAHWLVRSGPGTYAYDVVMAVSGNGGMTWSEPFTPHTDGTQTEHGFVALFPAPAGGVGAVWLDGRAMADGAGEGHGGAAEDGHGAPRGAMSLRYARFDGGPGPLDEALLDERTCDCCQNDAARVGDAVVVAYRDRSAEEIRDIAVRRGTAAGWEPAQIVHADGWQIPACPVNGPAVAAAGAGVAVAWFTAAADAPRVRVAFSGDEGRTFGSPTRIDGGAPEGRVDIQMIDHETAVVSWIERTADGAEIRLRTVDAEGAMGPVVVVAGTEAERASGFPRFVVTADELVIAWTRVGDPSAIRTAAIPLAELVLPTAAGGVG